MENKELCKKCQGQCCKSAPGLYKYSDIKDYKQRIGKDVVLAATILLNPDFAKFFGFEIEALPHDDKLIYSKMVKLGIVDTTAIVTYALTVRPRGQYDMYNISTLEGYRSIKNSCIHLLPTGCKLDHDKRPYQCKELVPRKIGKQFDCVSNTSKIDCLSSWLTQQLSLRDILISELNNIKNEIKNDNAISKGIIDIIGSMRETNFHDINSKVREGRV